MTPIVYNQTRTVSPEDIDELKHVNNLVYLQYLLDVAALHWQNSAPAEIIRSVAWVVKKHEVEYFHPAFLNEALTISTWVEAFSGVTSIRHYEIKRQETLIVKAQTTWVAIDPGTLKPKRVPADLLQSYFFKP